jgi:hypothetical protein
MQQVALPSLFEQYQRSTATQPFPLVRRVPAHELERRSPRKFLAGLLFGIIMSGTLALLGYEARIFWDSHPGLASQAENTVRAWAR